MGARERRDDAKPAIPVGGGVPVDPETGERFGYLPRKAAARKIIIRRTLGLPWILGALAAALLIAAAGAAFLLSDPGRPPKRYADEGALTRYAAGQVTPLLSGAGWVDRRDALTVWLTRESFCESDGGWGAGAARWAANGAAEGGAANLSRGDVLVADGRLYVDAGRATPVAAAPPAATPADLPSCLRARPIPR